MLKKNSRSLVLFPLLFVIFTVLPIVFWRQLIDFFSSGPAMQEFVQRLGVWGALGFILAQMLQVVFFIIPGNVLQVSAGYLFTLPLGLLYSFIGISIGTVINYVIGYKLGVPFVKRFVKDDTYSSASSMANSPHALLAILIFFFIPGTPKDVVVFAVGALQVNMRTFMIASSLARLPALIASVAIGASVSQAQWRSVIVLSSIALLLFVLGVILRKPIKKLLTKGE